MKTINILTCRDIRVMIAGQPAPGIIYIPNAKEAPL